MTTKSAAKILREFKKKNSEYWSRAEEKMALTLFRNAANRVPAYKKFLRDNKVSPEKIKTLSDYKSLPVINKENYLKKYPYSDLLWDGDFRSNATVFSSTSGSSGSPFYFPRGHALDWQSSLVHEVYLNQDPNIAERSTLVIIGFSFGVWIAGLITYSAFDLAATRGRLPLSIITPGINKTEIFKALKNLSPNFDRTILVGYPPFVKDIIDGAESEGIDIQKLNLRVLCAAEPFTENFRNYLVKAAKIKNRYLDTCNIYGSSDLGTMAFETPLSILTRTIATKDQPLFNNLFSEIKKTPTLAQYNPYSIMFEGVAGELYITSNNSIPLIRYDIGDHGGVYTYDEIEKILSKHNHDIEQELEKNSLSEYKHELPFVYVYERKDFSTTLYGLQIYPEIIRETLIENILTDYFTGKFALLTKFDKQQNQYLEINIETKKNVKLNPDIKKIALNRIVDNLKQKSSEFSELSGHLNERAVPKLVFWPAEHELFFKPGNKQKWVSN